MSSERDLIALLLVAALAIGCAAAPDRGAADPLALSWDEILGAARGQTVTWGMWTGDPYINRYVEEWVRPRLKERYGIELEVVSAQGRDVVQMLMTEIEAGAGASTLDVTWINGENFHQLRRIDALWGPFVDKLPAARFIDHDDPFIRYDFQQPTDGFECPWGSVQQALIYDSARVPEPPRDLTALAEWIRAHPGRFTIENGFTGMTLLKALLIHFAGGPGSLDGPFDEERYAAASAKLWDYLRPLKPYLWQEGRAFPEQLSQVHQLFAAGELDFTKSNNDGEVDNKVAQGLFPETARAYVPDFGTIKNTHYLGIPRRARNVEGSLVLIDFLISAEAQYEKMQPGVWGDGTVLDIERLPEPWPQRFRDLPGRRHAPPRAELAAHALREPAPEYMVRLFEDFRRHVIEP